MAVAGTSKRVRIVEAANRLFYEKGFNQTTFTDIAAAADLARGNFYHYFKSKDQILSAVIEYRLEQIAAMLDGWQREHAAPRDRLKNFIRILVHNSQAITRFGCPLGSLTTELTKTQRHQRSEAVRLFDQFRQWLAGQFCELGFADNADELAMHLLARTQGASLVGNAYESSQFLDQETAALEAWVDGL